MGVISPGYTQQPHLGKLAFILQSSDKLHIVILRVNDIQQLRNSKSLGSIPAITYFSHS